MFLCSYVLILLYLYIDYINLFIYNHYSIYSFFLIYFYLRYTILAIFYMAPQEHYVYTPLLFLYICILKKPDSPHAVPQLFLPIQYYIPIDELQPTIDT